jgi:pSer/pThr/pTyr-binding forkhead associated (FHA) protein
MARLILNCEGVGLVMHELGRDIVMIGRAPSNQIVIDHPTVSAQHAVLLKTGASYSLKDLSSRNGTQINDMLVTDAELKGWRHNPIWFHRWGFCRRLPQTVFKPPR